jgi:hypothetical protein
VPTVNGNLVTTGDTGTVTNTMISGPISVANGGTSLATLTANNVILGNGTSAPSFVAPGTTGNVLTSNGTTWTSAAAGGASAMTLISTQTASSSASISFTGLSGYDKYMLIYENVVPSSVTGASFYMQFGTGGGPTYVTSGYYIYEFQRTSNSAGTANNAANAISYPNQSIWYFGSNTGVAANTTVCSGSCLFTGITSSGGKNYSFNTYAYDTNNAPSGNVPAYEIDYGVGYSANSSTVTALKFYPSNGNFTSGTFSLYGISS